MPFRIVQIGQEGFQVLAALFAEAFDEPWPEPSVRELLATPGTCGFIALDNDETPVGFLLVRVVVDEAEILSIGVRPSHRRGGVARALMAKMEPWAEKKGAIQIFLEVGEDNPGAYALYRSVGFFEIGRRKKYYRRADGQRIDAILMVKKYS